MRYPIILAMAAIATPVLAHEMWIAPSTFAAAEGETVALSLLVGDAADVKPWKFAWEKLVSLRDFGPAAMRDLQPTISVPATDGAPFAQVAFAGRGTHLVALESYQQLITLEPAKFNAYIKEDGLTGAIDYREQTKATGTPGREMYSRRAKVLVQVGNAPSDQILQPIGQTLEIVPLANPYALGASTAVPVRVLYQGKPLAGALVALTALGTGSKPIARQVTDGSGRASFDVPRRAAWMISVVWTRPIPGNKSADYDTIFSSLTFGYPGEHPRTSQ